MAGSDITSLESTRRKFVQWLSPPDPASNHEAALKLRQRDTGLWLIDGDDFERWMEDPCSFLWLYGIRELLSKQAREISLIKVLKLVVVRRYCGTSRRKLLECVILSGEQL